MGLQLRKIERTLARMEYLDRKVKEIHVFQADRQEATHTKLQWAKMLPFYEQRYKIEEKRLMQ